MPTPTASLQFINLDGKDFIQILKPGGGLIFGLGQVPAPGTGAAWLSTFNETFQDGITATPAGNQATGFQLTAQTSRITTVTNIGDSVVLPASSPGLELVVINHGANAMQVFGLGADTVDDAVATVGVSQMSNSFVIYSCVTAGQWYTEGLANGYAGGQQTVSYQANITAVPGALQLNGPLTKMMNLITTAASGSGVTLMKSQPGMEISVINNGANSVNVFPVVGDSINALAVNAPFVQNNTTAAVTIYFCAVAGQWFTK